MSCTTENNKDPNNNTPMPDEMLQFNSPQSQNQRLKISDGVSTPRPTPRPQFFEQPQTFSTKKARSTPQNACPPKPPVKSAPPVSRIFAHKQVDTAQPVSFKAHKRSALESSYYNHGIKDLYFDQCFTIIDRIGCGSYGEVFKVKSKEDGKFYAIKRSREQFRGESDRKSKLDEVAKHEALPKHPNCLRFVKAWEEKQHLYIQTELCKASLNDLANQQHDIAESLVTNYMVDLLMALKHLHKHDLVHMDIKPDNIFIADNDICKLGDFGLMIDLKKTVDAMEGDPRYLAPELMDGAFGKPADVFSLGMTILELASDLDLPKGGKLWHALRRHDLPELEISSELKSVIMLMLEPNHVKRSTVEEILSLPKVKEVWTRRKRENTAVRKNNMLPNAMSTPAKCGTGLLADLQPDNVLEYSFSDDDESAINISNNSMGVPLNCSTSSEEHMMSSNEDFAMPSLPVKKAHTTPGYRSYSFRSRTSVSNCSPNFSPDLSNPSSQFSFSPVRSNLEDPSLPTSNLTPNSNNASSQTSPPEFLIMANITDIQPKNLMNAFLEASDSD